MSNNILKIHKRENPFIMIDKAGIEDPDLSWKASGLLTYLIGRPENWKISLEHLSGVKKDGRSSTEEALKELRASGYCHLFRIREKGKIKGSVYLVFETKVSPEEATEFLEIGENEVFLHEKIKEKKLEKKLGNTDKMGVSTTNGFSIRGKTRHGKSKLIIKDNNNKRENKIKNNNNIEKKVVGVFTEGIEEILKTNKLKSNKTVRELITEFNFTEEELKQEIEVSKKAEKEGKCENWKAWMTSIWKNGNRITVTNIPKKNKKEEKVMPAETFNREQYKQDEKLKEENTERLATQKEVELAKKINAEKKLGHYCVSNSVAKVILKEQGLWIA